MRRILLVIRIIWLVLPLLLGVSAFAAETPVDDEKQEKPIVINGDVVEYSTDKTEVIAQGNVEIDYQGSILTCQKLTVNTVTKDGVAEGNAKLVDKGSVIEGERILYNFNTKSGVIADSQFRANPYFGKSKNIEKVSDNQFISRNGYITTCSQDRPHWRIFTKKMDMYPNDKMIAKGNTFYLGNAPVMYLPKFARSLKEPLVHVQVVPGKSKQWGAFLLTAWRYRLNQYIDGRIYLDLREKLGNSQGFGANYTIPGYGGGDFKFYYTQERNHTKDFPQEDVSIPKIFQRYLVRFRHKWDIDEQTNIFTQMYKITDSKVILHPGNPDYGFLKEYFPLEYEKETQPLSYIELHRSLRYASIDVLMQKRMNRWYSQTEMLPRINFSLPSFQLGESPVYYETNASYTNYNQKSAVPAPSSEDASPFRDVTYNQYGLTNRFSLPAKVSILRLTPFISNQEDWKDKYTYGSTFAHTFSTGSEATTKFYRLFDVQSKFLKMDINGLRHIITPTANYTYTHTSTMETSKAHFGGENDTVSAIVALELSNKLQTKRKNVKVDFAELRITSNYLLKPQTGKRGSNLSDIIFDLEFFPYSWVRLDADATFLRSSSRYTDPNYNHFSNANYDITFDLGRERSFSMGQRFQRKGSDQFTYELKWRLNPKWNFSAFYRYEYGEGSTINRGRKEHEYTLIRDLHCWSMSMKYNGTKGKGSTIWFIFTLKAFPELELGFDQNYHKPKSSHPRNN
ncbi:MAG: hypothetical protein KKC84_06995 [Candidatus Omnitrophica bacterium]|nr:hypothetical protein [Candidatus Omnitrophota bacterium]